MAASTAGDSFGRRWWEPAVWAMGGTGASFDPGVRDDFRYLPDPCSVRRARSRARCKACDGRDPCQSRSALASASSQA